MCLVPVRHQCSYCFTSQQNVSVLGTEQPGCLLGDPEETTPARQHRSMLSSVLRAGSRCSGSVSAGHLAWSPKWLLLQLEIKKSPWVSSVFWFLFLGLWSCGQSPFKYGMKISIMTDAPLAVLCRKFNIVPVLRGTWVHAIQLELVHLNSSEELLYQQLFCKC